MTSILSCFTPKKTHSINLLLFFSMLTFTVNAQNNKIDSLKGLAFKSLPDTNRVNLYYVICREYLRISSDSALKAGRQSLALAKKLNYSKGIAKAYNIIGIINYRKADYPQAIEYYKKSKAIHESINNQLGISQVYNNLGVVSKKRGNLTQALEYYQKSLKIQQRLKNQKIIAQTNNNLGTIHLQMENYPLALKYFKKALTLKEKLNTSAGSLVLASNNISIVLTKMGRYQEGNIYSKNALSICLKAGLTQSMATVYNQLGEIKAFQNQIDSAIFYQKKAIDKASQTKYTTLHIRSLCSLANIYLKQKKYDQAQQEAEKALQLAQTTKELAAVRDAAEVLYQSAAQQQDYAQAFKYQTLYLQSKDSLFNADKAKEMTQLEMNYAFDKKQALIKASQKAKEEKIKIENDKKLQKQQFYLLSALGVLFTTLTISIFAFRSRQIQKKLNEQLTKQKNNLVQLNAELHQNHEEIVSQRDYIGQQNHSLNKQKTRIESSIKVAQTIQKALLPSQKNMQLAFQDHFVIYRPKDIVSGDFYWVKQIEDQVITVVADCTGHGVPGAFMSLIGINILDSIIYKDNITDPKTILNRLHELFNKVLQDSDSLNHRVGMDAIVFSVSSFTSEATKLVYAGAKNPLFYIRAQETQIHELKGDRKSVGGFTSSIDSFSNQTITLPKGSLIYAGSDGLKDQNNRERKSFSKHRLIALLAKVSLLPLEEQKEEIEQTLEKYMIGTTQRDDMLWVGIKL